MFTSSVVYTSQEIAQILGKTERTVQRRAKRENWKSLARTGKGGAQRWELSSMPKETREQVMSGVLREDFRMPEICGKVGTDFGANAQNEAILQQNDPKTRENDSVSGFGAATRRNQETASARLLFVREIIRLAQIGGKEKAIQQISSGSALGTLPERLADKLETALGKEGSEVSRRTLYRWMKQYEKHGADGLVPGWGKPEKEAPEWLDKFLKYYQLPQNPPLQMAYAAFARDYGEGVPSIHAVRRQVAKMSEIERRTGRVTGNALLKLRPHKRRDTSELWPTDVYTADGTTFDAEMLHPIHGQPCKAEVTAILDVATRKCVGFSMNFAESSLGVLDALRCACLNGGVPAMFYSDNGPGYQNKIMRDDRTGIFQRLGIQPVNSLPGRPQGKGLMERAVKTLWVPAAQALQSYTGSMMDEDAARKNFKISRKALKEGKRAILPLWNEVRDHLIARINEYNRTPHRGLPRYRDEAGRLVHYTPDEYWQCFVRRGFAPVKIAPEDRSSFFMIGEIRTTRNGYVQLFGNKYFSGDLADFHGTEIEVRYSLYDIAAVACFDKDGRFICEAKKDGNKFPYFERNAIEMAREKRDKAALKRIEQKAAKIRPGATILLPDEPEECADFIDVTEDSIASGEAIGEIRKAMAIPEPEKAKEARPVIFETRLMRYCWLMSHKDDRIEGDEEFIAKFRQSDDYADMKDWLEIQGMA